jgi:transcriptional regulator with XRE-family HTH domain
VDLDIRAAREARGLSQKQLADLIGVHPSELSSWEHGQRTVPERRLWELIRTLGWKDKGRGRGPPGAASDTRPEAASLDWHATLRQRRQAAGLSQQQLADRALQSVIVEQVESGRREPARQTCSASTWSSRGMP